MPKKRTHRQIYFDWFVYEINHGHCSFIPCEITGRPADWYHAIDADGMGGRKKERDVKDIMAIIKEIDYIYGDRKKHKEWLLSVHERYMKDFVPLVNRDNLTEEDKTYLKLIQRQIQ